MTGRPASAGPSWAAWATSVVVAAALLAYLLRGIDTSRVVQTALNASPGPFVAFLGLLAVGVVARATRFWILIGRALPFRTIFAITLVRNLLVDLLPARLGELSYVYLVTAREKRPIEEGVSSLALAFLLDLVALAPLVLAALLVVGAGSFVPAWMAWVVSLVLGGAGVFAVYIAGAASRLAGRRLAGRRSPGWRSDAAVRLHRLGASFDEAKRSHVLLPALALSLVVRLCKYGSAYCLVLSLLIPLGYSMAELGVLRIFLGSVAAEVAASLPVHGLAGFGTYEAAWTLTLEELGYPRDHAVISGLLAHAITQGIEYVLGGGAAIWLYTRRPGAR